MARSIAVGLISILLVCCSTGDDGATSRSSTFKVDACPAFSTLLQAPDTLESVWFNFELTAEDQRLVLEQRFRRDQRLFGHFMIQLPHPVVVGEGLVVTGVRGEIDWDEPRDFIRHEQRLDVRVDPEGSVICMGKQATTDHLKSEYQTLLADPFESYATVINLDWDHPPRGSIENMVAHLVQVYWSSMEALSMELHGKPLCSLPARHALDLSSERPFRIRVLSPVSQPPPPPPTPLPELGNDDC